MSKLENVAAHPLAWPQGWPRTAVRKEARFSKGERQTGDSGGYYTMHRELTIADAVKRVLRELERLGVRGDNAIISTNIKPRLDGLPRSDKETSSDPGVAVYWEDRGGTKVMAIDRYTRVADNLAAIAATLEAMRAIQRHGGGQILERVFTGFTALPPPRSWKDILGLSTLDDRFINRETIVGAYRALARKHHPDNGGSTALMAEINAARDADLKDIGAPVNK